MSPIKPHTPRNQTSFIQRVLGVDVTTEIIPTAIHGYTARQTGNRKPPTHCINLTELSFLSMQNPTAPYHNSQLPALIPTHISHLWTRFRTRKKSAHIPSWQKRGASLSILLHPSAQWAPIRKARAVHHPTDLSPHLCACSQDNRIGDLTLRLEQSEQHSSPFSITLARIYSSPVLSSSGCVF